MHTETKTQIEKEIEKEMELSQNVDTSGTAAGAILARPDKPCACSACGTGFDVACKIAARAMLKVANTQTCTDHTQEEYALLLNKIEENNVLFQNCSCNPPKWAMNWRGPDLSKKRYSKWGGFHDLSWVRRDFRGKKSVKKLFNPHQLLSTHAASYSAVLSSSSAGSKRTSNDVDQTRQAAKQSGVEAAARPPLRIKLKPNPVAKPVSPP